MFHHQELEAAIESGRAGVISPTGQDEAFPVRGRSPDDTRIALRRGSHITGILEIPWDSTIALAFSSDGERIAAAGAPGGVCVWSVGDGQLLAHLQELHAWRLSDGRWCLPLCFALSDQFLVAGGSALTVVESSGWSAVPIADFPVVAVWPDPHGALIVGPDENGSWPVERLSLDTFTLSARGRVQASHPSTTRMEML